MTIGPVQLLVFGFEDANAADAIVKSLYNLRKERILRIVDVLVVKKDAQGITALREYSDLSEKGARKIGAVVGGLIGLGAAGKPGAVVGAVAGVQAAKESLGGLSEAQVRAALEELPNNSSAVIALIEHYWYLQMKKAAAEAGAVVFKQGMVTPKTLIGLGIDLAAAAEQAKTGAR